jgi:hypothetical protein
LNGKGSEEHGLLHIVRHKPELVVGAELVGEGPVLFRGVTMV